MLHNYGYRARGGAVGWGTALQAGRSRVRFPMLSMEWHYPSCLIMALGVDSASNSADNLATFMCRLSWNLGASTSWDPQGLSRSVMGLLYIYLISLTPSSSCLRLLPRLTVTFILPSIVPSITCFRRQSFRYPGSQLPPPPQKLAVSLLTANSTTCHFVSLL